MFQSLPLMNNLRNFINRRIIMFLNVQYLHLYNSYILIGLFPFNTISILNHLCINLMIHTINQQVMKDIPHIGRPMEKQFKEHFLQQVSTQVLPKL